MRLDSIERRPLAHRRLAIIQMAAEILQRLRSDYTDAELEMARIKSAESGLTLIDVLEGYQDFSYMVESAWATVFPDDEYEPTNKLHYDIYDGAVLAVAGLLLSLFREETV